MPAATSLARLFDAAESTAPVSVTVAFRVSTSIDCDRRAGSDANADFTCWVSAVSSAAPPDGSPLGVTEVPGAAVAPFDAMVLGAVDDGSLDAVDVPGALWALDVRVVDEAVLGALASPLVELAVDAVDDVLDVSEGAVVVAAGDDDCAVESGLR